MVYKMIVMDMDGTLLTNDKSISDANKRALQKAVDTGARVVISTGRIFASADVYREMLGVDGPVIASNGAFIKDNGNVIYMRPLGEDNIREILKLCREYGLYCHLFTPDSIYTEKIIYSSSNYTKWNKNLPDEKKVNIIVIPGDGWEDVINEKKDYILKAVITDSDHEKIKMLRQRMTRFNVEVSSSAVYRGEKTYNIEIMDKGVTKASAVSVLAQAYDIKREEIICIGDSENDIPMIEFAGLGVAMANGTDEAKSAADFVTLSNEEDGVAYVIKKFILDV